MFDLKINFFATMHLEAFKIISKSIMLYLLDDLDI
jgi:hypothetical protein